MEASAVILMSVENPFEEDYIRRTERFKALSTFDQFLAGIRRAFVPIQGGHGVDLDPLYEELKRVLGTPDARIDVLPEALGDLDTKLDFATSQLRGAEMALSPSLTRRYFERVRPLDERIPFYLLRFYLSIPDADEDLRDKVDYLSTVAAAGNSNPVASPSRSREEIRGLFERLLADSVWPRIDGEAVPEIARAFDDLAAQIANAQGFDELAGEGLIESLRTLKRQVSRGLAHPEILTAAALCNLKARAVFRQLFEKEEQVLREVGRRIDELEGRSPATEPEDAAKLKRFRESRRELDRQAEAGTVRWRQLVEVHQAATDALRMLSGVDPGRRSPTAPGEDEGVPLEGADDPFWRPCLRRVLSAVEAGDTVQSIEGWRALAECKLDPWEADAARRAIARRSLTKPDRVVLFAAALRVKAESETEATRRSMGSVAPDLLRNARATLMHASELDRTFAGFAIATHGAEVAEDIRRWTRTRLRLLHATSALWLALDGG
jgi:hypothetical protein